MGDTMKEHNYDNCHNLTCRRKCQEEGRRQACERILERLEDELKLADANKIKCIKENALMFDTAKGYVHGISTAINILSEEMEHENKRAADCRLDG